MSMQYSPSVWGPHYWFFLHTIAMTYPHNPNAVTKKKYYEFIQTFPLLIPVEQISGSFSKLLDEYPVAPYLDSRIAFVKWTHFIHNKINQQLEKPTLTLSDFYEQYYHKYKSHDEHAMQWVKNKKRIAYACVILIMSVIIWKIH